MQDTERAIEGLERNFGWIVERGNWEKTARECGN